MLEASPETRQNGLAQYVPSTADDWGSPTPMGSRRTSTSRVVRIDSAPAQGGNPIQDSFQCYSCGRKYRWRQEISGKTMRCKCGSKMRCPELHDETMTAGKSLDDTVQDVVLDEHLDHLAHHETIAEQTDLHTEYRRIYQRGIFGWPIGGEVFLFGVLSVVGVSSVILAFILGKHFWWWIVAAVLIGPYAWWRLYIAWPRWKQGRSWTECLEDIFSGDEQISSD